MNILGIDWGEKKMGLALAVGTLAEPLKILRYEDLPADVTHQALQAGTKILITQIKTIVEHYKIEKIVVGVSEGASGIAATNFANLLKNQFEIPVETYDETLSSQDARALAIDSGIKRKKRKEMEDAFAAAVMLQSYLDNL